ncbi:methylated-DNA--[protein]-cysteine S-methyltransferase [Enterobacter hormaechei]
MAKAIGKPNAVRAVAGACGANKLAIVIPCHRVVVTTARCRVIARGAARKALLLKREANNPEE